MNNTRIVSIQILEKIFNYLGTKPYREVAELISLLQKEIMPNKDKETDVDKVPG
jgi:hypothetical protein